MIKKIGVAELRLGMFVHDLDCGWMSHPFLRNRFRIDGQPQIHRIVDAGIRDLYIDTSRGFDAANAPTLAEVDAQAERDLSAAVESAQAAKLADAARNRPAPQRASLREEFRVARQVHAEANRAVRNILQEARLGRQVSVEQAEPVVERIADSILRNPGPILALCRIKTKDEYTFMHSVGVSALMIAFCRAAGLEEETVREAGLGGLLHDIGKMSTPDAILNKPGKLSDDEFAVMKNHVVEGRRILEATPGLTPTTLNVAAQHHERFDGSGYPLRLKGDDISPIGQMSAIVDVYDAITSDRVYHKGMQAPAALKKILEWTRAHFNPDMVRMFIGTIGIYPTGTLVMLESGRLAVVLDHEVRTPHLPRVRVVYDTVRISRLAPYDVDLAGASKLGGSDRILRHEPPEKWSIDPLSYLG